MPFAYEKCRKLYTKKCAIFAHFVCFRTFFVCKRGYFPLLKAQANQTKGEYKLTDLRLEYEVIESENLVREVKDRYNVGRSLGYDYTTLLKTLSWNKDSTLEVIDINIPRKSLKTLVLLFTDSDEEDSEHFPFPNLEKVNVTVEGNPNDLYSEGLAKRNMYDEAQRFFGNGLRNSFVSLEKFYVDKFACVLDFRTVDDEKVSGSGRNLIGTQAGILLEIEKKATSKNLACHVFVIADGIIDVCMYVCVCKTLFQHAIFVNYLHPLVSTKGVLCTLNLKIYYKAHINY